MVKEPHPKRIVFIPDARREMEELLSLALGEAWERRLIHAILILTRRLAGASAESKIVRGDIRVTRAFGLYIYFLLESDRVVILRVFAPRE